MIGVDLGGTNIKIAEVVGQDVVRSTSCPTPAEGPAAVLDAISKGVLTIEASPDCIGLAIPGEVDASGRVYRLPNVPGFEGMNIAAELGARTGATVVVENDATAAALGECLFGHGRTYESFVMVTLGTGIGGGVVLDGSVRRGAHGFAGEIGHIPIDPAKDAWPCVCGQRGCVESYAGTAGLLRKYGELGGRATSVGQIADAARTGDAFATATFEMMGWGLARLLTAIQNLLDLDAFVFSGGISRSFDLIEPHLRENLRRLAFAPPLSEVPLCVSRLMDQAGVIGAAYLPEFVSKARSPRDGTPPSA